MTSTLDRKRVRKDPATRRAEIVAAAGAIALAEGLECVTLRRVADDLAVRPGLISHYFPSADDLVAEAYGSAAGAELDLLMPASDAGCPPTVRLGRFFARTMSDSYDEMSRLWVNVRHLARYRPLLAERVHIQEAAWRDRLGALLTDGIAAGEFSTADPEVVVMKILVVLDGLSAHVNTGTIRRPEQVNLMGVALAEQELGLPAGALLPLGRLPDADAEG
ncbi:TetR family transcriptional regulator C-terminal domain-containing protein [Nakamurella sp.]|uniref:TetR family transcriptional regulator C-terminal domain-containing protein n=1 Tax=Nakamurella sp. TaxID=1869182 RepID=UPI003782D45B